MYVLFQCDLYDDLRKILFSKINERNKLFTNRKNRDKVCFRICYGIVSNCHFPFVSTE